MEALVRELLNRLTTKGRGDLKVVNDEQLCTLNSAVALEINRRFGEF